MLRPKTCSDGWARSLALRSAKQFCHSCSGTLSGQIRAIREILLIPTKPQIQLLTRRHSDDTLPRQDTHERESQLTRSHERPATMQAVTITPSWKIESIEDTRQRGTDRKHIPGSGDIRDCECCGRAIEAHANVADGNRRLVIGTQCAKKHGLNYGSCGGYIISPSNRSFWTIKTR